MLTRSQAFAAQARADLNAYNALSGTSVSTSHRLHYLQMWLEKLCKAYLWLPMSESDGLLMRHQVIGKVLPRMVSEHWRRIGFDKPPELGSIRRLCREIDLLHPQVDDSGRRPDNVEYPWVGPDGDAKVPADWTFRISEELYSHSGRLLLKAAMSLTRDPTIFLDVG